MADPAISQTPEPTTTQTPSDGSQSNAPTPITLSDDSLVIWGDRKEPVKYGEHLKSLQGGFTRKAQEAATYKQQLEAASQRIRDFEQRAAQFNGQHQAAPDPRKQAIEALKDRPYITGAEAAQLAEYLSSQQPSNREYEQGILLLAQHVADLKKQFGGINQERSQSSFEKRIGDALTDAGIPNEPQAVKFAKALYLSHEGEDLDSEFPSMLKKEWADTGAFFTSQRRKAMETARLSPFTPAKGGDGRPGAPKRTGRETPAEIAAQLFPMIRQSQE